MNERKDEKWLDEQLQRAINTTRPEFNAQAWKQKFPQARAALTARTPSKPGAGRATRLMMGRLATAAVILVAVAVLIMQVTSRDPQRPAVEPPVRAASPARMVSMMSLRMAYRQGGEEGLNRQLDAALSVLGPRPNGLSMQDLFNDSDS